MGVLRFGTPTTPKTGPFQEEIWLRSVFGTGDSPQTPQEEVTVAKEFEKPMPVTKEV